MHLDDNNSRPPAISQRDTIIVISLAVLQGLFLWFISEAAENKVWIFDTFLYTCAGYAVVIAGPSAFQLLLTKHRRGQTILLSLLIDVVISGCAAYIAWSATIDGTMIAKKATWSSTVSLFFVWFIALPFVQSKLTTGRWKIDYSNLYHFAWRNTLTLILTAIVAGISWLLLFFWANLFEIIEIKFFSELFGERWFAFSITGFFIGVGLCISRTQQRTLEIAHTIILGLFKWLLPVVCLILMGFIVSLLFSGIDVLLRADYWVSPVELVTTGIILLVLCTNGIYRDGKQQAPFNNILNKFVVLSLIVAPIFAAISIYGLALRIIEYGWSIDRFWATIIVTTFSLYIIGYAVNLIKSKGVLERNLSAVNIAIALALIPTLLLANSPILNPMTISAASQINRLERKLVSANDFDYTYLRHHLGKPGNKILIAFSQKEGKGENTTLRDHSLIALAEASSRNKYEQPIHQRFAILESITWHPDPSAKPEGLLKAMTIDDHWRDWKISDCYTLPKNCQFIAVDLNNDQQNEYVLMNTNSNRRRFSDIYAKKDNYWEVVGQLQSYDNYDVRVSIDKVDQISVEELQWKMLKVGETRYSVTPK